MIRSGYVTLAERNVTDGRLFFSGDLGNLKEVNQRLRCCIHRRRYSL